jgi:Uma2 family endonuclease
MGHIHGVPDIVVEVLSDSTRERDLGAKADRYLSNGVKEYWIADPSKKTLDLWINELTDSPKRSWRKINADEIQSKVLPELVIKPGEVFTEACF